MRFGSATVARMRLSVDTSPDGSVAAELLLEPDGYGAILGGIDRMRMTAELVQIDGTPKPRLFTVRYDKPDRYRHIRMRFDPRTGALLDFSYDNNGRPAASEVPEALRRDAMDPLTAFFQLRRWAEDPGRRPGESTTLAVFEGRKRLDVVLHFLGSDAQGRLQLRARLLGRFGFDDGLGFVETERNPGPIWLDVVAHSGPCGAPESVVSSRGFLRPSLLLVSSLRQPRRRRCPSRATAAAARPTRTSRARCRSRPRARPSRRAAERWASWRTP